jgi:hypothetical protein
MQADAVDEDQVLSLKAGRKRGKRKRVMMIV